MDRQYIDDHHIVARYLADALSDAERQAFETYYLEHPEVVREMEAAARFKAGLLRLRDSGELTALLAPPRRFTRARYIAIAAVVAVITVAALLLYVRSPSLQPTLAAHPGELVDWLGNPRPIASTHVIMRMRGNSYDAEIELPADTQVIELRVLPEIEAEPRRYRVALAALEEDDSLQAARMIGGLAPAADGFVVVFVNTARLEQGRYRLTLAGDEGTSAANDASDFLLRVRSAGASAFR